MSSSREAFILIAAPELFLSGLNDIHLNFNEDDQDVQKEIDERGGIDFILDSMLSLNLDATSGNTGVYKTL